MATTISPSHSRLLQSHGRNRPGAPEHNASIEKLGGSLSDAAKDALFAGVSELENAGASFEQIKSFVDSELEANGVDLSGGARRSGQLIDMMS